VGQSDERSGYEVRCSGKKYALKIPGIEQGELMKRYIKQNRSVYDSLAVQYSERILHKSQGGIDFDFLIDNLVSQYTRLYKKAPQKVLELGPGAGETLRAFSSRGFCTTAIEFSKEMAKVSHKNSPKTMMILEDALSFRDFLQKQFDIVFAGAFLHLFTIKDEEILLRKIRKWMSDESLFCLYTTVHEVSEEGFFPKSDYGSQMEHFRRRWNREDLRVFLTDGGFAVVDAFENCEADRNKQWLTLILRKM